MTIPRDVGAAPAASPNHGDAVHILSVLGFRPRTVRRFPTGLMHYVYDVRTEADERLVLRLARADLGAVFAGAAYWHDRLRRLGVPLPKLFHVQTDAAVHGFPVMLMERLPGTDLGAVYARLTRSEKAALADQIVAIQARVATLPLGSGFGYAGSPTDPLLKPAWSDVLDASVARSRRRIAEAGVLEPALADRVQTALDRWRPRLAAIAPTCFLDDTTTKNVIVYKGRLSGIVDVDTVCYGDPLLTPALTRTALLAHDLDTDYIDCWTAALALTDVADARLDLYTAICCLDFLSEVGRRFNKAAAEPVEHAYVARLTGILDDLPARL